MNIPRYAAAVAKLLRRNLPSSAVVSGDEARGAATIERAMHTRVRRRRLVASCGAVAAAAVVSIATTQLVGWGQSRSSVTPSVAIDVVPSGQGAALAHSQGGPEPLKAHVSLESGQRIDTPVAGGASLHLSTGTSMVLSDQTSFRVDSQGATQRFSLQRGALVAQVAKLTGAQRFIVDTPDAEVEVRGTRFRLQVIEHPESCGSGTRTRLEVTEGVVEVRGTGLGTASVKAGEVWPADCSRRVDEAPTSSPAVPPPAPATVSKPDVRASARAPVSEAERASALTAPNDLFAEAVVRARRGDTGGALRAYQQLVSRFPTSPLAENAMVERMRLLAATPEGATEAKRYLARYPRGFAADEAKTLLGEP